MREERLENNGPSTMVSCLADPVAANDSLEGARAVRCARHVRRRRVKVERRCRDRQRGTEAQHPIAVSRVPEINFPFSSTVFRVGHF